MKKTFSFAIFTLALLPLLTAQSGGGTSFDRRIERFEERAEQFAEEMEVKAETLGERWEQRAERWETRAEQMAENMEDRWENSWSAKLGFARNTSISACPEISFLGIETHEVSIEKAKKLGFENRYGSYVSRVMAKSAAESAGLQAFDYIYGVDEQRTSDNQSLSEILEDYGTGDEVTLYFVRKGQKMSTKVKLANTEYGEVEGEEQRPFLGVSPTEDDEDLDGVAVEIVEKSTAEEMGLIVGDVITSINGFRMLDWDDVTTAIQNTKPGQTIDVNFQRGDRELTAKGTIKAYEELYPEGEKGNWNLDIDWDKMGNVSVITGDNWDDQVDEQDENRAFLGIYTDMISKEKADKLGFDNPFGTYITGIIPGSGAEKAGLKPFDYIYGFDEYRAGESQHLGVILKKFKPGEKATVHFIRKGKLSTASIVFTKPFKADKLEMDDCEDSFLGINQKPSDDDDGVSISPVKNSTAMDMGLKDGDVITQINGYPMLDWQDITTAIGMLKPGDNISVDYLRGGQTMKGSKAIKSVSQTKNCPNCDCGGNEVAIATTPSSSIWSGWNNNADKTATPRMDLREAKIALGNIATDETSLLRSKGVQLTENSSLAVENLKLTPNTTTGLFSLDFNLPTSGNTIVRIYNLSGRELYEYDMGSFTGKFTDNVDISQNGPGNYFIEIRQGAKVFTKKITLSKD